MIDARALLPELQAWNEGRGIAALDWLWIDAKSDAAIAYAELFWPRFVVEGDCVLRVGFSPEHLAGWRKGGMPRRQIEAAVNYLPLGDLFSMEQGDSSLIDRRVNHLGSVLCEIYEAKLARDFPDRRFVVSLVEEEDDYYLTFRQA